MLPNVGRPELSWLPHKVSYISSCMQVAQVTSSISESCSIKQPHALIQVLERPACKTRVACMQVLSWLPIGVT